MRHTKPKATVENGSLSKTTITVPNISSMHTGLILVDCPAEEMSTIKFAEWSKEIIAEGEPFPMDGCVVVACLGPRIYNIWKGVFKV
jgi:hypothetical protein